MGQIFDHFQRKYKWCLKFFAPTVPHILLIRGALIPRNFHEVRTGILVCRSRGTRTPAFAAPVYSRRLFRHVNHTVKQSYQAVQERAGCGRVERAGYTDLK